MKRVPLLLGAAAALAFGALWLTHERLSLVATTTPSAGRTGAPASPPAHATAESPAPAPSPSSPSDRPKAPAAATQTFGGSGPVTMAQIPEGRFKEQLRRISPAAQRAALDQLGRLHVPVNNVGSLSVDEDGYLFYQCAPPENLAADAAAPGAGPTESSAASVPASQPPTLHSRSGSTNVIYLDFNGEDISGTNWNKVKGAPGDADYRPAVAVYYAKAFDLDGDPTTFNDQEQAAITEIWQRVAEDYAAFNIDVTTEAPASFTSTTGRVLVTSHVDANGVSLPSPTAGGVAYLDAFGQSDYATKRSPAFVYFDNLAKNARYIAEACSHEMGHNLSLSHDGTSTVEYYQGHGSGETSWAPIMGTAYYKNVSQWSKGEYYDANNLEDDIALIAAHVGYAPDDNPSGKSLTLAESTFVASGVIGALADTDAFTFTVPATVLKLAVSPLQTSQGGNEGNLDVDARVYDSGGTLVWEKSAADRESTIAARTSLPLTAGTYRLEVSAGASGNPQSNPPTGFTAYGSLGQYAVSAAMSLPVAPSLTRSPGNRSVSDGTAVLFSVGFDTGNPEATLHWQRQAAGTSTWADLTDGADYAGTGTAALTVSAASLAMDGDAFRCRATNLAGEVVSGSALLTVRPATPPQINTLPPLQTIPYGNSFSFTATVNGTSPFTVQWSKDGTPLPASTGMTLYLASATDANNGVYTVTATNKAGTATSTGMRIVVDAPLPPDIRGLPPQLTYAYGNSMYLSPNIVGSNPLTYVWKKNGTVISGATSYAYNKYSLTTADSGTYTLDVTNNWGTAQASVVVTVNAALPPSINPLSDISATEGSSFSIYPSVSGTAPFTYQWYKDGQPLTGATLSTFSRSNLSTADGGTYKVLVTNSVATVSSNEVTVRITPPQPPTISSLPEFVLIDYGSNLYLSANIGGTYPFTYQWSKDGTPIPGATSSSWSKSNATTADNGSYTLTVSNGAGTVTSAAVPVTVRAAVPPTVFGLPRTIVVAYGGRLSLSPTVLGTSPMVFQWQKDGNNLPNGTYSSYSQDQVSARDAGTYLLTATNAYGTAISTPVTVLVDQGLAPAIYGLTSQQTVSYGRSFSLGATVTGTTPLRFQWMKNGIAIPNATSSSYYVSATTDADAGDYTLVASNDWGTTTSSTAVITVLPPVAPSFTSVSSTVTAEYGQSASLSATVSGTTPMTFVWRKAGTVIPQATGSSLSISGATEADSGDYTVTATNLAGEATSPVLTLTVNPGRPPVIPPLSSDIHFGYGSSMSLGVTVSGTNPVQYTWQKDGTTIYSGPSATFAKAFATTDDAGTYVLVARNAFGTATSNPATVVIDAPLIPVIANMPTTRVVNYGDTLSLYPSVSGTGPIYYEWYRDGNLLIGYNNSNINLPNAKPADSGTYSLIAYNAWGSATSTPVNVSVNPAVAPQISNIPGPTSVSFRSTIYLYMTVSGTTPMTYQWRRDGTPVAGSSSTLYLSNATEADSGSYTLTVTNAAGSVTSPNIPVTVLPPEAPVITQQPAPVTIRAGLTATFSATATGSPDLSWQWYHDGNALTAATSSSLTVTPVTEADFGDYHVVVTNPGGSVESDHVSLSRDPQSAVIAAAATPDSSYWIRADHELWGAGGNSAGQLGDTNLALHLNARMISQDVRSVAGGSRFVLILKNDDTLWTLGANDRGQLGTGNLIGTTEPRQVATEVAQVAAGTNTAYYVKKDGTLWGMGGNDRGQLGDGTTTNRPNAIKISDHVRSVAAGSFHTVFVKTDGSLWGVGGADRGQLATTGVYNQLTPVAIADNVANAVAGDSHTAFLRADGTLWTLGGNDFGQLGDGTTTSRSTPGQIATGVTAIAAGNLNTFYLTAGHDLWGAGNNSNKQLGSLAAGSTQASPVKVATDVAAASVSYATTLYITGEGVLWGMGNDSSGQLGRGLSSGTVLPAVALTESGSFGPTILQNPTSLGIHTGTSASFAVAAIGSPAVTGYQWQSQTPGGSWEDLTDDATYAGVTTPLLRIATATSALNGFRYQCRVTAGGIDATSAPATLDVHYTAATITSQPADQAVTAGDSFTLSVVAADSGTLAYQWYRDGMPIDGADQSSYTVPAATIRYAGVYTVVITNADGPVTSNPATVSVARLAQDLTFPPIADLAFTNNSIALSATASSGLPVVFSVVSGPAAISGSQLTLTGTGTITVEASQQGDDTYLPAASLQRSFTITANLASWSQGYFDATERADSSISGPDADPDHDGLSNLLEYALGLDPRSPNTSGLPEIAATSTDWTYTFTRPSDRPDLVYQVEGSTDLINWSAAGLSLEKIADDGHTETWRATMPLSSASSVYFHIKITQN